LQSTLDTAVQAGITSLVTDVDFKDAFKGQAALNMAGSILGGGSPFDLFKNKAAQPAAQGQAAQGQVVQPTQGYTPADLAKLYDPKSNAGPLSPAAKAQLYNQTNAPAPATKRLSKQTCPRCTSRHPWFLRIYG
jgi:hypothetical protein